MPDVPAIVRNESTKITPKMIRNTVITGMPKWLDCIALCRSDRWQGGSVYLLPRQKSLPFANQESPSFHGNAAGCVARFMLCYRPWLTDSVHQACSVSGRNRASGGLFLVDHAGLRNSPPVLLARKRASRSRSEKLRQLSRSQGRREASSTVVPTEHQLQC